MTKEEAIKVLDQVRQWTDYPKEAFTMAIDALSQPSLPSNLDEAANKFAVFYDQGTCDSIAQECFKAGAKWDREQIMKNAKDGWIDEECVIVLNDGTRIDLQPDYEKNPAFEFEYAQDVQVIVLPKED